MRKWLLPVLVTLLAAALLHALAWQLVRQGIDRQARTKAAVFAAGHTPWDFTPHSADDLIAGRAFGDAKLSHDDRGLIARATGTKPYELGVPLPYPVDLDHFPRLRLVMDVEAATHLRLLLGRTLTGPLLASQTIDLTPGTHERQLDLRQLRWTRLPGHEPARLPRTAAMLRLNLQHSQGTSLHLRAIDWESVARVPGLDATRSKMQNLERVSLPIAIPEDMLALRDLFRDETPSAIVVATPDALQSRAPSERNLVETLAALLAYGLFVLWAMINTRRRPLKEAVQRVLPAVQIAVCAGPLLAFTIGMFGHPGPGPVWLVAMGTGLGVAVWLAWRGYGEHWRWLRWQGRMAWHDWAMPALTILAAAGLLLVFSAEPNLPVPRRMLGYGLWAGLQQLLILAALTPRMRHYLQARWLCALGLAVIFALAHAPNAMLMELTLLAELLWAWQFLRRPVLLPIILAHAAAGLLLASGITELPLRSLEVGARFLQ